MGEVKVAPRNFVRNGPASIERGVKRSCPHILGGKGFNERKERKNRLEQKGENRAVLGSDRL